MSHKVGTLSVLLPLLTLALLAPLSARADCTQDIQCKDNRVCQDGRCVDTYAAPPYDHRNDGGPPPWAFPRLHGVRSYGAIGAVGDFLAPTFGGISGEAQASFRFFETGNFDGGLTLNILDDLTFGAPRYGTPVYATVQGGVGFDFGLFRWLQFGPRLNVGYGSDVTNQIDLHGGFVTIGGHVIFWFSRFVGIYGEADALVPLSAFSPSGVRLASGFAFAWDNY